MAVRNIAFLTMRPFMWKVVACYSSEQVAFHIAFTCWKFCGLSPSSKLPQLGFALSLVVQTHKQPDVHQILPGSIQESNSSWLVLVCLDPN